MNSLAHMLAGLILYSFMTHKSGITLHSLLSPDYLAAIVASLLPDVDHFTHLKGALKSKRFGVGVRSWLHEFCGYVLVSTAGLILYYLVSPDVGLAVLAGITTHYLLDAATRPTRPFYPMSDEVMFYYLAPKSNLRDLTLYDAGITGILLGTFLSLTSYDLPPVRWFFILGGLVLLLWTIPRLERPEERRNDGQPNEAERLKVAMLSKRILYSVTSPLIPLFKRMHPNRISGIGLLLSIPVIYGLVVKDYLLAFIFLFLSLLVDVMDGIVARERGESGSEGWVVDVATDRISEMLVTIAMHPAFIALTIVNTVLSIRSLVKGKHLIIPLRHIVLLLLLLTVLGWPLIT